MQVTEHTMTAERYAFWLAYYSSARWQRAARNAALALS
jgi:hypothetical protein